MNHRKKILQAFALVLTFALIFSLFTSLDVHAQSAYSTQNVADGFALYKTRGHLLAALAVWQAGQYDFAATHVGHAKAEVAAIADDLKVQAAQARIADVPLNTTLDTFAGLAAKAGDSVKFTAAHKVALEAVDKALQSTVGTVLADQQFQAAIMDKLIHAAESDYESSLKDGKIANPVEYQDALSFVTVAGERWTAILGTQNTVPDGGLVIEGDLSTFKAILPDFVKLPQNPADSAAMEKAVDDLSDALHTTFKLPEEPEVPSNAVIDKTRAGIATALADYKAGKADDAYDAAASAYLDNFESLESMLRKQDSNLVDTLEGQFKALRDGIKAGKPAADLDMLAEQINANLDKAAALLAQLTAATQSTQ